MLYVFVCNCVSDITQRFSVIFSAKEEVETRYEKSKGNRIFDNCFS